MGGNFEVSPAVTNSILWGGLRKMHRRIKSQLELGCFSFKLVAQQLSELEDACALQRKPAQDAGLGQEACSSTRF